MQKLNQEKSLIAKVELLTNIPEAMAFLSRYEESSQFLINNLRDYGPSVTEEPYSGNFKVIREHANVVAVFYIAKCGNLYAQAIGAEYTDLILEACGKEPNPIKGFLGAWNILAPLYESFSRSNLSYKPSYFSKEILYRRPLETGDNLLNHHPHVRLLTPDDFADWFPLRKAYLEELHLSDHMGLDKLKERFLQSTQNDRNWWGFFEQSTLSSIAGLNSKSESIGQIGGVFTPKTKRQRGLSKATMLHMLKDCRDFHRLTKSILFTGETDTAAQKLYESINYHRIGHFALILS